MKCLHILYLYMGEVESIVLKVLSTRCSVQLCRAGEENGLQKDGWDLVVLQDAVYCLLQTSFCHKSVRCGQSFRHKPVFVGNSQRVAGSFGLSGRKGGRLVFL